MRHRFNRHEWVCAEFGKVDKKTIKLGAPALAEYEQTLIHRVYDTALDNSLWPEMLVSIVDHVNRLEAMPEHERDYDAIQSLNDHFGRAFAISDRLVLLQEENANHAQIMSAMAFDVILFDMEGRARFSTKIDLAKSELITNAPMHRAIDSYDATRGALAEKFRDVKRTGATQIWSEAGDRGRVNVLLPKSEVLRLGFPPSAECVLLTSVFNTSAAVQQFSAHFGLSRAHARFLTAFVQSSDVRLAAEDVGITYETGRKYLKAIFNASGAGSQSKLIQILFNSPAVLLENAVVEDTKVNPVRRMLSLSDGAEIEYFSIGPEDGYPVFYFDALAGNSIDSLGHPERYRPVLQILGMRLITPCRPGCFRSSFRKFDSVRDYAGDVEAICTELGLGKIALLSYSHGSNVALGVAHALADRVERVVMSSVSYMRFTRENWRDADMFFLITNVIGRRWPALLNRLIPFLARSVIQNVHPFAERMLARASCEHERVILGDHGIRARTSAMVRERTAMGMEGVIQEYRINAQSYDFDIRDLKMPLILLHGDCDMHNPLGGAELLAREAPNAKLHVLKDMGHHHIFLEWDWIFAAAMGRPVVVPPTTRHRPGGAADRIGMQVK
jgi:pimeloyl-ACP methyl ester carboxylesterase